MCGIFGCVLHEGSQAAPLIHAALKRLEYRGYDSVGEVTVDEDKLTVKKDRGRLEEVHAKVNLDDLPGPVGVGHTRWATHGRPAYENSHPLVDCKSRIAVVHNGIIENYLEIKRELEAKGHVFQSRTDTEVVPHMVEDYLSQGMSLEDAFRKTVNRLEGAYAIVLTSTEQPETILCARQESPLVLGIGEGEYYCGSDFAAFLPLTRKAVLLDEGEMAVLNRSGVRILNLKNAAPVKRDPITIQWEPESAKKQGFRHFMLKEIHEQAQSLRDALRTEQVYYDEFAKKIIDADKVFVVACGTSFHAGLVGSLALTKLAGIDARVVIASEFSEEALDLVSAKSVILAISQSGETMDTLNAVRDAKAKGATVLIVLIQDGFPVIFVAPKDETHKRIIGNIMEMKARGAHIISIIEEGDEEIRNLSDRVIEIGESLPSLVTPLVYVVPMQLLAYYLSVIKGHDPDYPRNLAKSVTVE